MNILAVDFGTRRMGLAWVDTDLKVALPFGTIEGKNLAEISQKFVKLILTEKIDRIVIGLPFDLSGRECANTERVRKFVERVKKEIKIPIDFIDERFTSQAADKLDTGVSRDEKAAILILEDYLKRNKIC